MKRPSRGDRASAATRRYVGCFFLPIRMRRSFTATLALLSEARHTGTALAALAALAEEPHHLLHLLELLEQLVDVVRRHPTALCHPQPAGAVHERRVTPLGRGHRPDDGFDPCDLPVVDLGVAD